MDDAAVLAWLRRRGYKEAEIALRKEAQTKTLDTLRRELDVDGEQPIPRALLLDTEGDASLSLRVYEESYLALRKWVDNSIDAYKADLEALLYPIFVYIYLSLLGNAATAESAKKFFETYRQDHTDLHDRDLQDLANVPDAHHIKEDQLCQRFLGTRYLLRMSRMAYSLYIQFITEQNLFQLTRLTHQHLGIRVTADSESKADGSAAGIGPIGESATQFSSTNQRKILLGRLPPDKGVFEEMQRRVKTRVDAGELDSEALERLKQLDPETAQGETAESSFRSPNRDRIPLPASKFSDINGRISALVEASNAVKTNSTSLPSVCAYTFHNTYGNLNSLSTSLDTHLVAGGFQDSTIRLWNLSTEHGRGSNARRHGPGAASSQLVGHAGPVYGTGFSPDNKYLVSSSADRTARLWSLETMSNIVCYKGHNYPIWDVDFGPEGLYFATASSDRTARLWSCDQIYPLRVFVGHLSDVEVVRFHPNSNYVLTGSGDKTCRLWDVQNGDCVRIMKDHAGAIRTVAISPDGRTMASGGEDTDIVLWDLGSAQVIKKMRGHTDVINSLSFSSDGNVLVSGSADKTVRLWSVKDAETGEPSRLLADQARPRSDPNELGVFATKKTPIFRVAFSRRNLALALGVFSG